ncbi:TfoX/Sxy family protein [Xanthobacter sp. V4C-4]|uniref:TfoX/Sxy family protein n=1 Tax=Xanthobacter cornucopiae TaxID=3119924 RepID=UPI00372A6341
MDAQTLDDLFSAFGPVRARRMFGGAGLYADGLMFALEADGLLYLKADAVFAADLAARGAAPFTYVAKTGPRTMGSFWRVPDAALDDPEDLAALARRALEAAQTAAREKPPRAASARRQRPARPIPTGT